MSAEMVSLITLGRGAAVEKFGDELEKVMANILDPNTKADGVREITLKVKIKPSKQRDVAAVAVSCVSKLQAQEDFGTQVFIGKDRGRVVVVENDPNQLGLFQGGSEKPSLTVAGQIERVV